ncbi:MAG: hypothetical protein HY270_03130 [Deltaproteobacteria bacterium]|nr:hypothetical protein [Deltaproteobacteria bacterium]
MRVAIHNLSPGRSAAYHGAVFLVMMSNLLYELLLTRIFSATMWYHFAFMAVSIALLGTTAGAVATNLWPRVFASARADRVAVQAALLYALSLVACTIVLLRFNPVFGVTWHELGVLAAMYLVIAVPFLLSGIFICVALIGGGERSATVYCADLMGAGLGCALFVPLMSLSNGPRLVLWLAVLAALGAAAMAIAIGERRLLKAGLGLALLLAFGALVHADRRALQVHFAKGVWDRDHDFEKWNAFTRLTIDDYIPIPFGWGIAPTVDRTRLSVPQKQLMIDGAAFTVLTGFDGDAGKLQHLEWDVTVLPHVIRASGPVLVVGVGGGRDLLTALHFGHRRIVGVEVNGDILDLLRRDFAEFAGHLDARPEIELRHDEARSFAARTTERFDVLQASLVDTWAAAASGAYVLSENSLYTVEAFARFFEALTPRGVLSLSRWYYEAEPAETLRLLSLAATTLRLRGIAKPRDHLFLARGGGPTVSVGTLLVAAAPFSSAELQQLRAWCQQHSFDVVLEPESARDDVWTKLVGPQMPAEVLAEFPLDLSAPTDDRPFFFNMLRPGDVFRRNRPHHDAIEANGDAVAALAWLFLLVVVLSGLLILAPLVWHVRESPPGRGFFGKAIYFAALGLGFILIEIALMQRLMIVLGHPVFGLTVVLSALLVSAGLGSLWVQRFLQKRLEVRRVIAVFMVLLAVSATTAFAGGLMARSLESSPTWIRIVGSLILLAPLGFMLGMPLVLGLALSRNDRPGEQALYWGVNGAASVCGSILATFVSLTFGITAAYWAGIAAYAGAAALASHAWRETR